MDEREVELLESDVRRSLRTLDDLPVAPPAAVSAPRPPRARVLRVAGSLATAVLVVVLAAVAGDRLAAFRTARIAASPKASAVPLALGRIAPDPRYGVLARLPGKDGGVVLVDELGHELIAPFEGLVYAKTSPNGRYIALWLQDGDTFTLRVLDGVTRTVGAPLFTTNERFPRLGHGMAWASDSSAVLVVTTADPLAPAAPVTANLRAIDLAGNARLVRTYRAFGVELLAWDRADYAIVARAITQSTGGGLLLRISEDGSTRIDMPIDDDPIAANDAGTFVVAASLPCDAQRGCQVTIHDAATYRAVARIDLPSTPPGAMWAVQFRPRSSDLLVSVSRGFTAAEATFALVLYPDAGRGAPRDLGTFNVNAVPQGTKGAPSVVPTPTAFLRADGSAALFLHPTQAGAPSSLTEGLLVDLMTSASASMTIGLPAATVVLDPALVPTVPTIAPNAPVTASVRRDQAIALVRSLSWVQRVDRIEAKLVTWREFEPVGMGTDMTGGKAHGGDFPPQSMWAVAVGGDIYPDGAPLAGAKQHHAWSIWGINASRLQLSTLKVGDAGTWPPGFDALADHPASVPPPPTPSPSPIRFDHLNTGPGALRQQIHDIASADLDATHLWAVVNTGARAANGLPLRALLRSEDGGASWDAVTGVTNAPFHVAAAGSIVLVSDYGYDTASNGTSTSGGLYVSTDGGATWKRVTSESVGHLFVARYQGRVLFMAEHPWATKGAASGASRVFASSDGERWREIGAVPGPANFAMLDVPIVAFSKNIPGEGVYRVEGASFEALHLVALPGSPHAGDGALITGPASNEIWSFSADGVPSVRRSVDGGRTWVSADTALAGRIAGLFRYHDAIYALGDGAYQWDGARWRTVSILTAKVTGVFQLGETVIVQQGADAPWRSPP